MVHTTEDKPQLVFLKGLLATMFLRADRWRGWIKSNIAAISPLAIIFLLLFAASSVPAQVDNPDETSADAASQAAARVHPAEKPSRHLVNITIAYPIGTNQNPDISTNLRWSFLYGRIGEVRGLAYNSGVSLIQRNLYGVQVTGLYSQVGGNFRGGALTIGLNYHAGDSKGAQLAGLVNFNQGSFWGLQFASLFNYTEDRFWGAQATSLFNLNDGSGSFLQVAGIANANAGDFSGVQLTAFFNYTNGECRGVQLGNLNTASRMRGIQFGLANLAGEMRGLQVGLVNLAGQHHGWPVGVVNLAENSNEDWITYASNLAAFNTGIRTTINRWYSMLTVGAGDLQEKHQNTAFLSWHYGRVFPLGRLLSLNLDLGFVHIMPEKSDDPDVNDEMRPAAQVRLLLEALISKKTKLFGGIGTSSVASSYSDEATSEDYALFVLGLSLF